MSPKRKEVERFGRRGKVSVRVVREETASGAYHRVLWVQQGRRRTESYPDTRAGKAAAVAFAEGVYAELMRGSGSSGAVAEPLPARTLREVFTAYGVAAFPSLREASVLLLQQRWGTFETYAGREKPADQVTRETLDGFVAELRALRRAPNQIKLMMQVVRLVFRWAVDRDLIRPTKVTTYQFRESKADRTAGPVMQEFRTDDVQRILGQFDPRDARQWRPWALVTLLAYCGPRIRSALHLTWADVDFGASANAGTVTWRAEFDKTGRERVQPLPAPVVDALRVAYGWRCAQGYTGPWVFYSAQARTRANPWTYQAFAYQLGEACRASGVARAKWQGAHAFRRGVAGNVLALTGSSKRAAEWIGDRDVRVVEKHYVIERADEQRGIAEQIGGEGRGDAE